MKLFDSLFTKPNLKQHNLKVSELSKEVNDRENAEFMDQKFIEQGVTLIDQIEGDKDMLKAKGLSKVRVMSEYIYLQQILAYQNLVAADRIDKIGGVGLYEELIEKTRIQMDEMRFMSEF